MAYSKQTWVDHAAGGTPINAARLNHIEDGIAAKQDADTLGVDVAALVEDETSATGDALKAAFAHLDDDGVTLVIDGEPVGGAGGGDLLAQRATVAERQSRRARAELDAILAETLPGASLGPPVLDAGSSITGAVFFEAITGGVINPTLRYSGADVVQSGATFPDTITVTGAGLDSTFGTLPFVAEFTYDGAEFEFDYKFRVTGTSFRVWADGVIVGSVDGPPGAADGNFYNHLVTLPDARRRQIRLEMSGGTYFCGVYIEPGATVAYSQGTKGPRVIVLGDSYVEGAGATTDYTTFAYRLAKTMNWGDTWTSGSGGTGYLATPVSPAGRKTLRQRVTTDVIDQDPNIVIIAAGLNDRTQTATAVGTEAGLLFTQLETALPDTEFIVVGPWGPRDASLLSADTLAISAAIRDQAEARGWYFIDPIAEEWITGTGYVGATTGEGNSDTYISADTTHPTDAGHAYLAARLAGHLRSLGAGGV